MSARKGGLGRGLGALIPTAPVDAGYAAAVDSALFARAGAATAPRPERAVGPFGDLAPAVETVPSPEEPAVDTASSAGEAGGPVVVVPPASEPVQAAPVLLNGVPARLLEVPVASVVPNPKQPRQVFDEAALDELVASIREVGLLQPLLVRQTGEESFELVAGERRWRAIKAAGMDTVPVIVKDTPDDALLRDALLENLHREQLNPLEEAAAYAQLLEEFGATHEELARRIGRSRSQVTNTLRLLQLTPSVQRRLAAGVLTAGHARALLGLADPQAQESLAARIVAEGLSVRAVEEIVALGDEETPARTPRTRRFVPPRYVELGDRLGSRLDTRVTVAPGTRKGKIVIEFGGDADLARIVDLLEGSFEDPHAGQADVA